MAIHTVCCLQAVLQSITTIRSVNVCVECGCCINSKPIQGLLKEATSLCHEASKGTKRKGHCDLWNALGLRQPPAVHTHLHTHFGAHVAMAPRHYPTIPLALYRAGHVLPQPRALATI